MIYDLSSEMLNLTNLFSLLAISMQQISEMNFVFEYQYRLKGNYWWCAFEEQPVSGFNVVFDLLAYRLYFAFTFINTVLTNPKRLH